MTKQIEIRNDSKYIPVLDHGFVGIVDAMGSDGAIVSAARVSYGDGTKTVNEDRGLIRYLVRHRHCYHPSMQVLTVQGWKRWDVCKDVETFLVPDPKTHTYLRETLEVKTFQADEDLYTFSNERMSYKVTSDHKMWFKGKYQDQFAKVPVQAMSAWGWFEPMNAYSATEAHSVDDFYAFIGFYLGDGSYASTNRVSFHLRKGKKNYLFGLLDRLGFSYSVSSSSTYEDGIVVYVETPDLLRTTVDLPARTADKRLTVDLADLTRFELQGLFEGLVNSDGSIKSDREQIQFSSASDHILNLFMAIAPHLGLDAHRTSTGVTAYPFGRTSLESRRQYHGREAYRGTVYCATTSTGLLMVRGDDHEFGFVCGNTSPIEMCEVKLHLKMPIFIMRQWVRHRTASLNEYSGRYSLMTDEMYVPAREDLQPQSKDNKQGREGAFTDTSLDGIQFMMEAAYDTSYKTYQALVTPAAEQGDRGEVIWDAYGEADPLFDQDFPGLARELARIPLPLATYTELYWKQNLHNLLHLIKLRRDGHAQKEIRDYAEAVYSLIRPLFPLTIEAWEDYVWHGRHLSRMEIDLLNSLIWSQDAGAVLERDIKEKGSEKSFAEGFGLSLRELREIRATWGF